MQIIDTSFATPLRLEGRILQIEEDLAGSLADTKITLGNIRQSYTQRLAAQQQALDKLVSNSGAWNSAAGGTGPYMKDLIDRINQIMNATGGYTYLKPGQASTSTTSPKTRPPPNASTSAAATGASPTTRKQTETGTSDRSPTAKASSPTPSSPAASPTQQA